MDNAVVGNIKKAAKGTEVSKGVKAEKVLVVLLNVCYVFLNQGWLKP